MDMENFRLFQQSLMERCQQRIDAGIIPIFHSDRPPKRSFPVVKRQKPITAKEMKGPNPVKKEKSCCLVLERKPKQIRCRRQHYSIPYTSKLRKMGRANKLSFLKARKASHDFICLHHWRMLKYSKPSSRWPHSSNEKESSPSFLERMQLKLDEDSEESDDEEVCKPKRGKRGTTPVSSEAESDGESTISSLGSAEYSLPESEEDEVMSVEEGIMSGEEEDEESVKKEEPSDDEEETDPQTRKESHVEDEDMEEDMKGGDDDYASDDEDHYNHLAPWNFEQHVERLTEEVEVEIPNEPHAFGDPCNWQKFAFSKQDFSSSDEDSDDESETEEAPKIGLHLLPAATLRRYRKAFHIPTKSSATKSVMLHGVSHHFSQIEIDRSSTLAAFFAKTKNFQNTSDEEEEEE